MTSSPSFGDARITLAHTLPLTLALETRGTKQTGRKQMQFIIHITLDNGHIGIRLGQQLGNAAGIKFGKTHGRLLCTAETIELEPELGHALGFLVGNPLHLFALTTELRLETKGEILGIELGTLLGT